MTDTLRMAPRQWRLPREHDYSHSLHKVGMTAALRADGVIPTQGPASRWCGTG